MPRFIPPSERYGLRPAPPQLDRDQVTSHLRQDVEGDFFEKIAGAYFDREKTYKCRLLRELWTEAHEQSILSFPSDSAYVASVRKLLDRNGPIGFYDWIGHVHYTLQRHLLGAEWDEQEVDPGTWKDLCNERFEKHKAAWRFVGDELCPVSSPEEVQSLELALLRTSSSARADMARLHLERAMRCFSGGDYPNTGKEAISALEALARTVTERSDTLGQLAGNLTKAAGLHPAHGKAISNLYGTTSDGGYRHALEEGKEPTEEEARFILITVSAYLNLYIPALTERGKL